MIDPNANQDVQSIAADPADRVVPDQEKALVKDWWRRIDAAKERAKDDFKRFEANRKKLRNRGTSADTASAEGKVRTNLHFANMAAMLPQVYAKDPEYTVQPTLSVDKERKDATLRFARTAEIVLTESLVKAAGLKKQAKKSLRSTYTTSVGWLKLSWQERRREDPLIINQIKDTQDNIDRLQMLIQQLDDPSQLSEHELTLAKLNETMAGLQSQTEVAVARGLALDFTLSEDILIIDDSVRAVTDYPRAAAIGNRVWMTAEQFQTRFGYKPKKAKTYRELNGQISQKEASESATLLCVWELWSQEDNRVYYVCDGEEGFCEPPSSPEWTGRRWYPFFLIAFNEIDGSFYPLSDIELTDELVQEYNRNREDFVRDRKACLPVNLFRKGGGIKDDELDKIANREGSDMIGVTGTPGKPISDDIQTSTLGNINPQNYDTSQARADIEQLLGGGDASRGTVMKAKTATEAEILATGLRSRSAERQDIIEDMLNELGTYALEICLRKMTDAEVKQMAGEEAEWPSMSIDQIFNLVQVEVRGGSTGKPNRLQEQDRWTKLLPVINDTMKQVAELRSQGQETMANVVIELARETMRRFDERLDIEQFLPPPAQQDDDPETMRRALQDATVKIKDLGGKLELANTAVEKGLLNAATQIATSQNPAEAAVAFMNVLRAMPAPEAMNDPLSGQQSAAPEPPVAPAMPEAPLPPEAPMAPIDPTQLQ